MILEYLQYLFKAKNEHSLHSPFLFDFYTKILKDRKGIAGFKEIENLRKHMLRDERMISITDYGAGSKLNHSNQRKIKDIAKNSQKTAKFARLFYRIIKYYHYHTVIDLGTSLGVTTSYLGLNDYTHVYTFEGCTATATIAQENFNQLGFKNIDLVVGDLNQTLAEQLAKMDTIDFAFFDANHRYEPTVGYFEKCLTKINDDSCFIFDDIYWSEEMKMAWETIRNHPEVTVSIDLFWVGIVFFRKKQPKQHFVLRF